MDIWEFNRQVSSRLLQINIANMMIGQRLTQFGDFWRGFGMQAVGWSLINMAIAVGGGFLTRRRLDALDHPFEHEVMTKEAVNLRRILWINVGLDVLYMIGGLRLAQTRGREKPLVLGSGIGIIVQGLMLFVFDLVHARLVPSGDDRK